MLSDSKKQSGRPCLFLRFCGSPLPRVALSSSTKPRIVFFMLHKLEVSVIRFLELEVATVRFYESQDPPFLFAQLATQKFIPIEFSNQLRILFYSFPL